MTTPSGGTYTYTYDTWVKPCDFGGRIHGGISQKVVNDGISTGTWVYSYGADNITTVTEPNGRTSTYEFYGVGSGYNGSTCYKYGLMKSKQVIDGGLTQTTTYSWDRLAEPISNESYNVVCACSDGYATYVPVLDSESTNIQDTVYTTNYEEYDGYGNPTRVVETGSNTRTTETTYWYNPARNMVKGFPASTTVSGDSEMTGSFTSSFYYYTDSEAKFGRLSHSNKYGIHTYFNYDANGNLDSVCDGNNKYTYYDWSNGTIRKIQNPIYTINRVINWDGTIASETDGRGSGYTTSYQYDGDMRLIRKTPPIGNPAIITYNKDGDGYLATIKEQRGDFYTITTLDGLGRKVNMSDALGVTTNINYKANGTKRSEDSNIGDTILYDPFERISRITHKDGTYISYQYTGNDEVRIFDETNTNSTLYSYLYFGKPGDHYLSRVQDSNDTVATYTYNILGSLLSTNRAGIERDFEYFSTNLLKSETHPETGTTSYTRDGVGKLKTKTENLQTLTYNYDGINRLWSITASNTAYNKGYTYDNADNLTGMTSYGANITLEYDAANRLKKRTSLINGKTAYIAFGYDNNDNLRSINYPSGLTVNYAVNPLNQVTSITGFGADI